MTWNDKETAECERLLRWSLDEDLGDAGDLTSQLLFSEEQRCQALVVPRQAGMVAGLPCLPILQRLADAGLEFTYLGQDGPVDRGEPVARLAGPTRTVLSCERTLLNFLGRLSGIATLTALYVDAIHGTKAKICDTRKTTPGWRYLEKYAVRTGGGTNHRFGLFDAVLIKDNHIAELAKSHDRPVDAAVQRARAGVTAGTIVEVEIDRLDQLDEALDAEPDIILLDNMKPAQLREACTRRDDRGRKVLLEASGGVTLETVRGIAETSVDRISVGALTHSAGSLDLGLDDEPAA